MLDGLDPAGLTSAEVADYAVDPQFADDLWAVSIRLLER